MHKSFAYFRAELVLKLKFEYFIAKKILKNEVEGKKVSRPIVRIAIISISLAMLVNIITLSVVTGFQNEIRDKVIGFGSHAVVTKIGNQSVKENAPILLDQPFYPSLIQTDFVREIHPVAYKPALLQSTHDGQKEIVGVLVKGVRSDYNWDFIRQHLVAGKIPSFDGSIASDEIIISQKIARTLGYRVGDDARAFFVKNQPLKQMFRVAGIFETGLDDFDKELIFADIRHIQRFNDWGIQAAIRIDDSLANGHLIIKAEVVGGNGNYRFDWGKGYENYNGFILYPDKDTTIRLIASDYWMFIDGKNEETSIPDTAYLRIRVTGNKTAWEPYALDDAGKLLRTYSDETGMRYRIQQSAKTIHVEQIDGPGSFQKYVGAFEFSLRDWKHLPEDVKRLKKTIQFQPGQEELVVSSIVDNQNDIFVWLSFLDVNVWIILTLMIVIGIINMGSALLVMILIRTQFIGMLKALGATDWSIRKIFLSQAGFLILRGMIWGNVIGVGLSFLQEKAKLIKLNPDVYYLSAVPIELNLWHILLLNVATLAVCLLALLIPSYAITRISPVKAIRFN